MYLFISVATIIAQVATLVFIHDSLNNRLLRLHLMTREKTGDLSIDDICTMQKIAAWVITPFLIFYSVVFGYVIGEEISLLGGLFYISSLAISLRVLWWSIAKIPKALITNPWLGLFRISSTPHTITNIVSKYASWRLR